MKLRASRTESAVMMVTTLTYLAFEVAFGARLLDVTSSTMNETELHQIELAGRFISGIALTLFAWSLIVLPLMRKRGFPLIWTQLSLMAAAVICCLISYHAQEAILSGISRNSTPEQRQAAATLTLLASTAQGDGLDLEGIDIAGIGKEAPEMKTFLAILPALALSVDRLEERTAPEIERMLRFRASDELGNEGGYFEDIWEPARLQMIRNYNTYVEFADLHQAAAARAATEVDRMWVEYRRSLGKYTPRNLPKSLHMKVRRQVRARIPVPSNWMPSDEKGFRAAAYQQMMGAPGSQYRQFSMSVYGVILPDHLNDSTFFSHADVQSVWRGMIGLRDKIPLSLEFSADEVRVRIFDKLVERAVTESQPLYLAPVSAFADGGAREEEGIRAIRIAWIPLIAFAFSILGAFAHIMKTSVFAAKVVIGEATIEQRRKLLLIKVWIAGVVFALAFAGSRADNEVTTSRLFTELEEGSAARGYGPVAGVIRVVVQMQPWIYPVAEKVRTALGGITYDFDPDTPIPAFEVEWVNDILEPIIFRLGERS